MSAAAEAARARAAKKAVAQAIKVANVAAGSLATLAKDNIVNMLTITEEGGIQPLVDLVPNWRSNSAPRHCRRCCC